MESEESVMTDQFFYYDILRLDPVKAIEQLDRSLG
jgi:hypothetical protein